MKSVINQVLEISRQHMGIDCLDVRNRDHLDFHDLHVATIRSGLCEAYIQGQRSIVDNIDWDELREQKNWLLEQANSAGAIDPNADGLINLLDWIQDLGRCWR